jgi:hypothetical protein
MKPDKNPENPANHRQKGKLTDHAFKDREKAKNPYDV